VAAVAATLRIRGGGPTVVPLAEVNGCACRERAGSRWRADLWFCPERAMVADRNHAAALPSRVPSPQGAAGDGQHPDGDLRHSPMPVTSGTTRLGFSP
jgi:hypothetical protein